MNYTLNVSRSTELSDQTINLRNGTKLVKRMLSRTAIGMGLSGTVRRGGARWLPFPSFTCQLALLSPPSPVSYRRIMAETVVVKGGLCPRYVSLSFDFFECL